MLESIIPNKFRISVNSLPVFNGSASVFKSGDEQIVSFINELSRKILKDPELRIDPSFAALGYWLRKSNQNKIIRENSAFLVNSKTKAKPLGIVFHICPSNVDTMFFYSLVIALLAGNKNIVRISSRLDHPLVNKLFDHINSLLDNDKYSMFLNYLNIVKYDRDNIINEDISLLCDGRIVWGGDETINQFKLVKTKPKVKDLFFADRVSFSIIKSSEILNLSSGELNKLTNNLYNDIYTFDQKGCSSPHSLFVIGKESDNNIVLSKIYEKVSKLAELNYDNDVNSFSSLKFNRIAEDIIDDKSMPIYFHNNFLTISELKIDYIPHTCGLGYLYYKSFENINQIQSFVSEKVQTIGYYGFDIEELKYLQNVSTVDRIVPIGKALDFDYIWDGYNVFLEMLSFKYIK